MNPPSSIFEFGPFRFETSQQELRRRGRRVRISVSSLKLLTLFLARRGELVTREDIALTLWEDHGTVDVAVGINMAVWRLRALLNDDPASPRYIETVIGLGYRFVAEVAEVHKAQEAAPEPVSAEMQTPSAPVEEQSPAVGHGRGADAAKAGADMEPPVAGRTRFLPPAALAVGAALLAVGLGIALVRHRQAARAASPQPGALTPAPMQITFNSEEDRVTAEAISPDGQLVAYSDHYGISIHSLGNGADRLLTSPTSFLTRRIAWHRGEGGLVVSGVDAASQKSSIWAVFLHGEPPQLLLNDASLAAVSPDDSSVAYTRAQGSELWVADGHFQNARLLAPRVEGESIGCLLWSADSARLIVDRVSGSERADAGPLHGFTYESIDAATGRLLAKAPNLRFESGFLLKDGRFFFTSAASPGGARILIVNSEPGSGRILSAPQPAGPPLAWNSEIDTAGSLSVSANEDRVGAVLTSHTIDTYVAEIRQPGPTLAAVTRLTDKFVGNYPHAWSPEGDAVVFDGGNGSYAVCRQRPGEDKLEILAQLPHAAAMGEYSPDGKWILFTEYAGAPGQAEGFFVMPAAGGKPRQLPATGNGDEFHCSIAATGACVMRATVPDKAFVFYALDPLRGMREKLGQTGWAPSLIGDWSLSPDGATVAIADHDPDRPGIRLISLSPHAAAPPTTIPVRGFGVVREPTWSPDGKGFYVETKTASGYDLLYVDRGGRVQLLRESPTPAWGVPSRDGRKLAFPGRTIRANVWVSRTAFASPSS